MAEATRLSQGIAGVSASAFKGKNPTKEEVERIAAEAFIRNMEKCKIRWRSDMDEKLIVKIQEMIEVALPVHMHLKGSESLRIARAAPQGE